MAAKSRPLRLLVDTDAGTDDAVALILALRRPGIHLDLVTTVAGNTSLANATGNALAVLELRGAEAPVCPGASRTLGGLPFPNRSVHGANGLGDVILAAPCREPAAGTAADALVRLIASAPGAYTLVCLGPLTNVALALRQAPELARQLRRCVISGGNLDPAPAEFNVAADPEAANAVLRSGMPITVVPIELSQGDARLKSAEYEPMLRSSDAATCFGGEMIRFLGRVGVSRYGWRGEAALPDAVTMAIALDASLALQSASRSVGVETAPEATRGCLVQREEIRANAAQSPSVVTRMDAGRFRAMLTATLNPRGEV